MQAKSWNHFVELKAYDKDGNEKEISALYIVAVPKDDRLERDIDFKCYRPTYIPKNVVEKIGKAYGVATEFNIKQPEKYNIIGYRPDLDLYVFKENVTFEEGLEKVHEILIDHLKENGFEPIRIEEIPI